MSGEVASRHAQAAKAEDAVAWALGLWFEDADDQRDYLTVVLDALRDAGHLAPPPPRTWTAGDPEPDDVVAILDHDGDVWQRSRNVWWYGGEDGSGWDYLLERFGPVIEVHLPTGGAA